MAKKTLGAEAGKEIVLAALKGILSKRVTELHVTLGSVLPKKTDRKGFSNQIASLVSARNYFFASKSPFGAAMRIKDIIGSISGSLPGIPSAPEQDKPVPRVPQRQKPAGPSPRKEKKAKSSGASR